MKIATRLNVLSLVTILVMTAAVVVAGVFILENALRRSQERLMRLELQNATQAIQQKLNRSGVLAAGKEAEAQLQRLRSKEGFASAMLFIIERNDNRVVYHPDKAIGERAGDGFIDDMFRLQAGSLRFEQGGDQRLSVFRVSQPIDWLMGLSVSQDEVRGVMFGFLRAIGGITFAALCLNAIAISLFGRWLMRRIGTALECVNRIEQGDLSARVVLVKPDDEVGALQRGINAMGERIEQRTREQHEAQNAMLASEARLRRLVESSIIGVFFWDLSGGIQDTNDAFLQIIGYGRDDLRAGRINWARITPAQDAEADRIATGQLFSTGRCQPYEKHYIRKDGSLVPVLIGGVFLADSQSQGVAFVVDLTERKQAEADRQARREAETASRAKSEFLACMSHELRTPLNAVLGYSQILRREAGLSKRQAHCLSTIQASGEHLLSLINDLLDLAKIEAGKLELSLGAFDLERLIATVSDFVRVKTEEKQIAYACEMPGVFARYVVADEQRLRQVLLNLLDNAVKFTDAGQVRLCVQVLGRRSAALRLRFEVADTGMGMNAEELGRLFRQFEQVGDARRRAGGTGLGLSISQRLINLMGGEIRVDSTPGHGSRFWFDLDLDVALSEVEDARESALVPTGYAGPRRKVLIVDNVPGNRAMLRDLLGPLGFNLSEAAQGREALERVQADWPDLVLMDIKMPVMPGVEALRRLRALEPPPGRVLPPVIMMSASATPDDQADALAAGAAATMYKPIDLDALLKCVATLLALEWEFAPSEPRVAPGRAGAAGDAMAVPPPEQMAVLYDLAREGNMRAIRDCAERLAALDEKYRPFAQTLRQMASGFQSKAILKLIRSMMDEEIRS